jgi:arsenite methyltransferase
LVGDLPEALRSAAEMYAGCVTGAIQKNEYLALIETNGFMNVTLQKVKPVIIPDDILINYLDETGIAAFKSGNTGIYSITVYAEKPAGTCCAPGCCN